MLTESPESLLSDNEIKIPKNKRKLTFSEKYYNVIKVNHYGLLKYPGRFGRTVKGEKACTTFKSAYSCECGSAMNIFLHSCNNIDCPECYINSIRATAKRDRDRFNQIDKYLSKKGFKKRFLRHASINITEKQIKKWLGKGSIYDSDDIQVVRVETMKILKKLHFGGILIFHGYRRRRTDEGELVYPLEMVESPHFHFVGHGWIPCNFLKKFGFTLSHIRWLFNSKSVYNAIKYCLTHASYFAGKHILSWFGQYSYNSLRKIDLFKEFEALECKDCAGNIYHINLPLDDYGNSYVKESKDFVVIPWFWKIYLNYDIFLKEVKISYNFFSPGKSKKFTWYKGHRRKFKYPKK